MGEYKNKVHEWLRCCLKWMESDYYDDGIDTHINVFLGEDYDYSVHNYGVYVTEGIKIFDSLIEIARENDWLDDFMPQFRINLVYKKKHKQIKISSIDDLVRDMDRAPPEIYLRPKILLTTSSWQHSCTEKYERSLRKEFCEILGRDFAEEYSIYYEMTYFDDYDGDRYRQGDIYFDYNENKSEVVRKRNTRKLVLKEN
jgi:hypothetical protein